MSETILKPNLRALVPATVVSCLTLSLGLTLFTLALVKGGVVWWILSGVLAFSGLLGLVAILLWARQPRLGYENGQLLAYLGGGKPLALPVEVVEAFFLGTFPAKPEDAPGEVPAVALVARLAERAKEYHDRPVDPRLGRWQEGYITVRGNWCEPLTLDRVKELNHRLAEIHRQQKQAQHEGSPA